MNKISVLGLIILLGIIISCNNTQNTDEKTPVEKITNPTNKVSLASDLNWEKLNPARGDKSPQAATIWGDRKGSPATGFLVKFVDGFSSPPHIHNVTYRGMVIKGLVHNDDPNAEKMWMPAGSFWTQPAGESHITAAKGEENIAYIEIDSGPYLVKPTDEAFDTVERPVNVDKSNIIWLDKSELPSAGGAEVAFLWGKQKGDELRGTLVKFPVGFEGKIETNASIFHAVVIEGGVNYQMPNQQKKNTLAPGSHFSSEGKSIHQISAKASKENVIYIRTNGQFKISS